MAEWKPIETAPKDISRESDRRRIDLWVRAQHNGFEFRVPDCFIRLGLWRSNHYVYSLQEMGWEPLFWTDPPDPPTKA